MPYIASVTSVDINVYYRVNILQIKDLDPGSTFCWAGVCSSIAFDFSDISFRRKIFALFLKMLAAFWFESLQESCPLPVVCENSSQMANATRHSLAGVLTRSISHGNWCCRCNADLCPV